MNGVRVLQLALRGAGHPVKVDGVLGPQTISAVNKSAETRAIAGFIPAASDAVAGYKPSANLVTMGTIQPWIDEAVRLTKIPSSYLKLIVELEPLKTRINNEMYYRIDSGTGAYKGLGQMSSAAWGDAARELATLGVDLGSYDKNAYDGRLSILGAAGFALANINHVKRNRKYTGRFTDEQLYTMHNQGWTGFDYFARNSRLNYPKQSQAAMEVFVRAKNAGLANVQTA